MKSDKNVLNKVSEYRSSKGITQEELAKSIGVTRQTIIALEKGNYVPSVSLALRLSRFFEKALEEIFQLEEEVVEEIEALADELIEE
jgi:putative transcriptional regulator